MGPKVLQQRRRLAGYAAHGARRRVVRFVVIALALALTRCGNGDPPPPTELRSSSSIAESTFGMHVHDPINHWPATPVGYWRAWDARVDWPRVEPAQGSFDFTVLDRYVDQAEQHHAKTLYVLGNTPKWAAQDPTSVGTQGLRGATSPPTDVQLWQEFVSAVVTRYKGQIDAYEIWNEADL